ncbi:MAG: hypothetical protein CM15mP54_28360 [Paracoccaceae bacterium]|nr:MAG: hypothetical protein CM15mP54_28360 [Paracoccaceae bacterium]
MVWMSWPACDGRSQDPCLCRQNTTEGYAANFSKDSLGANALVYMDQVGARISCPLRLRNSERAKSELEAAGAILVEDPFAGTDFASYRQVTPGTPFFDGRGLESIAYDMTCYLKRLGESAAVKTWDEFAEVTHIEEVTGKGNILGYLHELPDFVEAIKSPGTPPAMPQFVELKRRYLDILKEVFDRHSLDGLVYPQRIEEAPRTSFRWCDPGNNRRRIEHRWIASLRCPQAITIRALLSS